MQTIVVDPSRTVLKIVGGLLESAGHKAHPFTDGRDALECLRSNHDIDALITSVELPTISGIELCRQARSISSIHRPLYIMVMSSSQEQRKLVKALEGGADDFIGKPPVTEELFARLRAAERLGSMQRDLVRLATSDPLTGLLNRRAFFEKAEEVCAHAGAGSHLSAIMFDIDHFKRINDTYGHGAGDQVIRLVADQAMCASEIAGRLGGEEFALLLRGIKLPEAVKIAEDLRAAVAAMELSFEGDQVKLSCSFGVDEWEFGDTIDDLLRRVDLALYDAKAAGRNRVVAFDPVLSGLGSVKGTGIIRAIER
ncbi:MAG: diguanylate cyclase [Bradyrhizobiaceae bacterium]|nr:diguanylate cyclase [Bradyrhizobiaceae bacterium]